MAQVHVVEILPHRRQGPTYLHTYSTVNIMVADDLLMQVASTSHGIDRL